jgi:hypothetical protein
VNTSTTIFGSQFTTIWTRRCEIAAHRKILNARLETAKGKPRCRHNKKHEIARGEQCVVIEIPMVGLYSYRVACAPGLVSCAEADLSALSKQLKS